MLCGFFSLRSISHYGKEMIGSGKSVIWFVMSKNEWDRIGINETLFSVWAIFYQRKKNAYILHHHGTKCKRETGVTE